MTKGAQLSLFGSTEVELESGFGRLTRTLLPGVPGDEAWLDYCPGWLHGHQSLLDELTGSVRWRHEERVMYERTVQVPRLYAVLPEDGPIPPVLEVARQRLSEHYGEAFERLSLGYYRNGQDSVAWHGDYVARRMPRATVATISVVLAPAQGGRSARLAGAGLGRFAGDGRQLPAHVGARRPQTKASRPPRRHHVPPALAGRLRMTTRIFDFRSSCEEIWVSRPALRGGGFRCN